MTQTKNPAWLTISEAASELGVSLDTMRRWDETGKLPAERDGYGRRTYSRRQVELAKGAR